MKADCGNSPKREFLRDFTIAYAEGNHEFITQQIADDVVWKIYGDQRIEGREAFAAAMQEMSADKTDELTMHQIITHGKEGAVNGQFQMADGKQYAFCDVVTFTSAGKNTIRKIQSYVIQTEK